MAPPSPARSLAVVALAAWLLAGCGAPGGSNAPTGGGPAFATPSATPVGGPTTTASGSPGTSPAATAAATPPAAVPTSGLWARLVAPGTGPEPREDHTWTVDDSGTRAYLFGGRDGPEVYGDLWMFDFAAGAWSIIDADGAAPDARFGHEAAWLPGRGLVVTLGQAGSGFFDDIWLFDPGNVAWRKLPSGGAAPVARYGSCSGVGPDGRLWISHGFTEDGIRFSDTLAYDLPTETWIDMTPLDGVPVERCLHACWWQDDGRLALYGGQTTGVAALGDLWLLDPDQAAPGRWAELTEPGPGPRQLAAAGRREGLTVVFGGRGLDRQPLEDTWVLVDGAARFVELGAAGSSPAARSGAAFVNDAAADRLLLFGGVGDDAFDDLWSLTLE